MTLTLQQNLFYFTAPGIYSKKIQELKTCLEKVAWLLKNNSHLRNCDRCLTKSYQHHVDGYRQETDKQTIHSLTPEESITRARRKIQNDYGLWLPTERKVIEARKINQFAVRDWAIITKEKKWE